MRISEFTPPIEINKTLNPKLWDGDSLRDDTREALINIAKEFYDFLDTDVTVLDLLITGSQVNYNYTKHSDLDLHLIVPFSKVNCELPVKEFFESKRKLWNKSRNINIRGVPVELYVEDVDEPAVSSTYSVIKNQWIKKPNFSDVRYDEDAVKKLVASWERVIDAAVQSKNLDACKKVRELLTSFRKNGLSKFGEFGVPNLVFKSLRNDGKIELLMNTITDLSDAELSI
jgi:hypothetical protein